MKDTLLEIIKFTLPSVVVLATAYLILRTFIDREVTKSRMELKLNNAKIVTPIRLQAYERLVLFLERISPETLFVRIFKPGMTTEMLHRALLQIVRTEFEHNLSQQVYISNEAWEAVKAAKESVLRLINTAAASPRAKSSAQEFSKLVIEAYNSVNTNPTENAIDLLKAEIGEQLL